MEIETKSIHAGVEIDPTTGSVMPPIYLTTTFERATDGEYPSGYKYARNGNPNRTTLEQSVAELEGGVAAAAFASGSVATMMLIQALSTGDHVIAPDDLYFGIRLILSDVFKAWGLETTFVDMADHEAVKNALQPNTKLIMIETPSNPQIKITDIQAIADIAHNAGAMFMVDNTIASPVLQNPIQHGADFVVHATTKYLGGHSDATGGMIVAKEETPYWERIKMLQEIGGAVPSPFECWLISRGVQTLPYRVRAHAENAMKVAQYLNAHPAIERVLYPGLPDHPNHDVAKKQMSAFGGLMSVLVKGDAQHAMAMTNKLKVITRATSFGGTHSLIEHRASIEAPGGSTPENLLRVSIGLENADDLIADFEQALG